LWRSVELTTTAERGTALVQTVGHQRHSAIEVHPMASLWSADRVEAPLDASHYFYELALTAASAEDIAQDSVLAVV